MAKEIIIQADSAAQALEQACRQLGKKQEELSFVVLKEAKKSIFGKIKEQAEIKITYDDQEEPDTAVETGVEASAEQPAEEDTTANKIWEAQEYLKNVLSAMGLVDIEQQVERDEDNVRIILKGDNLGVAIGRRGETLDALQYLVSLVANRIEGDYVRFIIDLSLIHIFSPSSNERERVANCSSNRIMRESLFPRKLFSPENSQIASMRFVLPCAFCP